jgi:hypothetical protein
MEKFRITKLVNKQDKTDIIFRLDVRFLLFGFIPLKWKEIDTYISHDNTVYAIENYLNKKKNNLNDD